MTTLREQVDAAIVDYEMAQAEFDRARQNLIDARIKVTNLRDELRAVQRARMESRPTERDRAILVQLAFSTMPSRRGIIRYGYGFRWNDEYLDAGRVQKFIDNGWIDWEQGPYARLCYAPGIDGRELMWARQMLITPEGEEIAIRELATWVKEYPHSIAGWLLSDEQKDRLTVLMMTPTGK